MKSYIDNVTVTFAESPTAELTNPAYDPKAKTPELQVSAVRVEKLQGQPVSV